MSRIVEAKLADQDWSAAITFESRRGGVEGALLAARRKLDATGRVKRSYLASDDTRTTVLEMASGHVVHVRMRRAPTSGTTQTAEQRRAGGRPVVTMTLSTEALRELDARRGDLSRGAFVEQLLKETA